LRSTGWAWTWRTRVESGSARKHDILIPFSSDHAALVNDDQSASLSEDIFLLASTEAKEQDEDCPGKGYEDEAPGTWALRNRLPLMPLVRVSVNV
jgi:hypothetical protein